MKENTATISYRVHKPLLQLHMEVDSSETLAVVSSADDKVSLFPELASTNTCTFSFVKTLSQASEKTQTSKTSGHETEDSTSKTPFKCHRRSADERITSKKRDIDESEKKKYKRSKQNESSFDTSSRITTVAEIASITSILCKGIHPDINSKDVLSEHFASFGEVKKVTCNLKNSYAIIRFHDHASAALAKKNGSIISASYKPVNIFWLQKSLSKKDKEKKSLSEVEDELHTMLEGIEDHAVLSRPEEVKNDKKDHRKVPKAKSKESKKPASLKTTVPFDASNEEMLKKRISRPALTPEEKFAVLDARDKLLRNGIQKQSDISSAVAIIGTCPDMCPEKERYSRFYKNCLSVFEIKSSLDSVLFDELNHKIIVKEYSRSSADQEEPLAHELRPSSVLMMTMNYLICNVIDNIEGGHSVAEWYDFIWNRTRAIRKDITQQHLCNLMCVEVVEKCARFHIYCAEALCEEEMAVFDPKINDENLTKCLQTLKHMYDDLNTKGIPCTNEAEFRAYDILLSLNEGDVLRHVQKLQVDIRESPEVRFAVSAAFSLNSHNYVRFFKLVQESTYLNACILHRYFSQVRGRALQVILKAYCVPHRTEQYPLQDLVDVLKFKDVTEAAEFCKIFCLKTDEKYVILDRLTFTVPVSTFIACRSPFIMESKRKVSVGEIINKGSLPANPLFSYKPHDSFDSEGCLKRIAFDASDQSSTVEKSELPKFDQKFKSSLPDSGKVSFLAADTDSRSGLFSQTLQLPVSSPSFPTGTKFQLPTFSCFKKTENLSNSSFVFKVMQNKTESMFKEAEDSQVKKVIVEKKDDLKTEDEEFSESKNNQQVKKAIKRQVKEISNKSQRLEKQGVKIDSNVAIADAVAKSLMEEIMNIEIICTIKNLYEVCNSYWKEISDFILSSILIETTEKESSSIAKNTYFKEKEKWLLQLDTAKKMTEILRARNALLQWYKFVNEKKRKSQEKMHAKCPILYTKNSSYVLHLDNSSVLLKKKRMSSRLLDAGVVFRCIRDEISWLPLNITESICRILNVNAQPSITCWKLLLLYFEDEHDADWMIFVEWLCAKFKKGHVQKKYNTKTKICSLYWASDHTIICIQSIAIGSENFQNTLNNVKENKVLVGTSGILLCLPYDFIKNQVSCQTLNKQLYCLLQEKPVIPPVPLYCFFVVSGMPCDLSINHQFFYELKQRNMLQNFITSELDIQKNFFELSEKLPNAVEWLLENCPTVPELQIKYLKDFIDDGVVQAFNVIYQDSSHGNRKRIWQHPSCIVSFFNTVMDLWASVASSNTLSHISWPAPEIENCSAFNDHLNKPDSNWNDVQNLEKIRSLIDCIKLPDFNFTFSSDAVSDYIQQVASNGRRNSASFFSSVSHYLQKTVQLESSVNEFSIPWADIIYECVQYLIISQNFIDEASGMELKVCYISDELESFNMIKEWRTVLKRNDFNITCIEHSNEKKMRNSISQSLSSVTKKFPEMNSMNSKSRGEEIKSSRKLDNSIIEKFSKEVTSELQSKLKSESQESSAFLEMLEAAVNENKLSIPSFELSSSFSENELPSNFSENIVSNNNNTASEFESENCIFRPNKIQNKLRELKDYIDSQTNADKLLFAKLENLI